MWWGALLSGFGLVAGCGRVGRLWVVLGLVRVLALGDIGGWARAGVSGRQGGSRRSLNRKDRLPAVGVARVVVV